MNTLDHPIFRETSHPWYMLDSHLKHFRRVIYTQKKPLHHLLKDPVSKAGLLRGLQAWPQQTALGTAPVAIHTHLTHVPSYFTVGYREGDIQGRIFLFSESHGAKQQNLRIAKLLSTTLPLSKHPVGGGWTAGDLAVQDPVGQGRLGFRQLVP